VIVVSRVIVAVMIVLVVADMEVEVEEAGAELTVSVPVAGGVQAQAADADDDRHAQNWAGQPGTLDHGSTKASHVLILTDPSTLPTET